MFFEFAELEPADRAARLEVLSQGDPELQAELERLLAAPPVALLIRLDLAIG
jgi:hypothetical protein